jgi:hypothetical protein
MIQAASKSAAVGHGEFVMTEGVSSVWLWLDIAGRISCQLLSPGEKVVYM